MIICETELGLIIFTVECGETQEYIIPENVIHLWAQRVNIYGYLIADTLYIIFIEIIFKYKMIF